ncbi:hypothetical protein DCS_06763 [Drechmeria coniospora]|uniref:Uncharacterized protein n=1 Tax=Drechmeria coniospora TaxID=98403 RepID=A0A151GCK4_DRECN|nr:hypothetical protein DCS_06763 [Drechmeria coniospora]KYK54803.1 hypothetical protein DCS_06763 [Drechmeria coniospora]
MVVCQGNADPDVTPRASRTNQRCLQPKADAAGVTTQQLGSPVEKKPAFRQTQPTLRHGNGAKE